MSASKKAQIVIIIVFTLSLIGAFTIKMFNLESDIKWSVYLIMLAILSFIVGVINVQEVNREDEQKKDGGEK